MRETLVDTTRELTDSSVQGRVRVQKIKQKYEVINHRNTTLLIDSALLACQLQRPSIPVITHNTVTNVFDRPYRER